MTKNVKYNLANFRPCLSLETAKTFMHALIFSHLSYCITCWGQAGETSIRSSESVYKQALKVLDKKPFVYHHCPVLEKTTLSFGSFRFCSCLFSVQYFKGLGSWLFIGFCPLSFCEFSKDSVSTRLHCTFPSLRFWTVSITVKVTTQWNRLPNALKTCTSSLKLKF